MLLFFKNILVMLKAFIEANFRGMFTSWQTVDKATQAPSICWEAITSWLILFVIFVVIFVLILCKAGVVKWLSKHILISAFAVWLLGAGVYIVGYYHENLNGVSMVLRSIVSSFKMFVVSNDLSRVSGLLRNNPSYITLFTVLHFSAAFITFLFIFKMVGYKIRSSWNLLRHKWRYSKGSVVHLFWGVNEASCLLAEDVHQNYPTETIIFVDIDEESEDSSQKKATLSNIANIITIKNSEIARLDKIGALIDHCYNGPASLNDDRAKDIFASLHLKNIGAILQRSRQTYFYFLSDNETQNIAGALNLQQDAVVRTIVDKVIYVHARKDANNEVFDHYSQYDETPRAKIKLIDSSYLSIATLKDDERALPVNCVEVDKTTGYVTSPFTALIVGFGGTGLEAFKFLYEYSAFVGPDMKRSPFRCYAIDANISSIAGLVREKMPAISDQELTMIQASVDSEAFWNKVKNIISDLNYVVIALNDDALGLSLAVNLFKYALQNRDASLPMLKIMLRCYNNSNEIRMSEVVRNLNHSVEGENVEICLYGKKRDLYRCKTILSNNTLQEAKEFHAIYENSELSAAEQWSKSFGPQEIARLMRDKKMSRYHAIYDINRRIMQNISNSLHRNSKMILMGFGSEEYSERLRLYYGYASSRKEGTTTYECNLADAKLLQTIAMVEHERWVASHKLMGYTYGPEADFVKKQHPCLRPWTELDEMTQSYDCNVVDATIKMAYKHAKR